MSEIWQIELKCGDAEEQGWMLFEHGAIGVQETDPQTVRASIRGTLKDAKNFIETVARLGFIAAEPVPLPQENWVAKCSEMLEIITVGSLCIRPFAAAEEVTGEPRPGEIVVIPGSGFGTGHHPSTRQALALLQSDAVREAAPRNVYDFGCGSGILSIACCKLYNSRVLAVDIDSDAISNATEIALLNGCAERVDFQCPPDLGLQGEFDIICANLFSEVLLAHRSRLLTLLKAGGYIIVAGILPELSEDFERNFGVGLKLDERLADPNWHAFLFSKA